MWNVLKLYVVEKDDFSFLDIIPFDILENGAFLHNSRIPHTQRHLM